MYVNGLFANISGIFIVFLIFGIGAWQMSIGTFSLGGLIAFEVYANMLKGYISGIPSLMEQITNFRVTLNRVNKVLDIDTFNSNFDPIHPIDTFELQNITFSYGEDKQNVMSVIPSKHVLFNETIKDNITLKKDFSQNLFDEIINVLDINKTFDLSLDKILGQTKDSLSDGQKQRIILARGLLENKKVIVMDEPENHLDSDTKKAFGDYVVKNKKNKIIIISTHNQQLLDSCDYIISLSNFDMKANLNATVK